MGIRKYISEKMGRMELTNPPMTLTGVLVGVVAVGIMYFGSVAFVRFRDVPESFLIQIFAIFSGFMIIMLFGALNAVAKRERRTIEWYERKLEEKRREEEK